MEINKLNGLINKVMLIKNHLDRNQSDPLLVESYKEYYGIMTEQFGTYLQDLLHELYDEHFEDYEVQDIHEYMANMGVEVESDDFPGVKGRLFLKAEPLRFVLSDPTFTYKEILWTAC